ncbi:MAG: hypothetical protein H6671_06275 [Anaerolineaceae bacterium]|nr:hypothetical protein [Anaerolineaceae bacterium]
MLKTTSLVMLLMAVLLLSPVGSLAQSGSAPAFNITLNNIHPPTRCTPSYWAITYDRTTSFSDIDASTLTRYFVQYINNDLNLVHYWESGYSEYVQDYWVSAGTEIGERAVGAYTVPFWTDTYQAESIEYILKGDEVIWVLRATLTCEQGEVVAYDIISEASQGTRDALPDIPHNLVVALEDIPLYGNPQTQTDYWGTIQACQTFFITDIRIPRASILVWGRESITGHI